jgi:hypothetical protein
MSSVLTVYFPDDFEKRYKQYKALLENGKVEPVEDEQKTNPSSKEKLKQTIDTPARFPHKLSAGTTWENFIIQFINDDEVSVQVIGKTERLDYKTMGFEDKRSGRPNSQWTLLLILAKHEGEISWKSPEANDKFKKWKERLASQMQSYFAIDYDPFYPYKTERSYKIKITLIPPSDQDDATTDTDNDFTNEMQQFLNDDND